MFSCLHSAVCRGDGGKPISLGVGFYGSPALLWEKGLSLPEVGVDAVVVGYQAITSEMVEKCHSQGAHIFADFPIFVGAKTAEEHPELWPIGANGKRLEKEGWYLGLCPTYDWFRKEKLAEMRDFLKQKPVDGVFLDFIRWPCFWEGAQPKIEQSCFCDNALSLFSQETGVAVYGLTTRQKAGYILRHHLDEWVKWRAEKITSFVREAKTTLKDARPQALLGIFVVPWRPEEYDDAIEKVIGQDFATLAENVDVFAPMVYHSMCDRKVEWVGDYSTWLAEKTGKPVWPIVQASENSRALEAEEFAQVLREALSPRSNGALVFTLEALLKEPQKLEIAKEAFEKFKEGTE